MEGAVPEDPERYSLPGATSGKVTHSWDCGSKDKQMIPFTKGDYERLLREVTLQDLCTAATFLFVYTLCYLATYLDFDHITKIPFYQRFFESIIFALCYFQLRPGFGAVAQIICGANIYWYHLPVLTNKAWTVFLLSLFQISFDAFRGFCFTTAFLHLTFITALGKYEKQFRACCLGSMCVMLVTICVFQAFEWGVEDFCVSFVVFHIIVYAETEKMTDPLSLEVLGVALAWMCLKLLRMRFKTRLDAFRQKVCDRIPPSLRIWPFW